MESIRRRRNSYALLFIVNVCLTVWFGMTLMIGAAFVFGTIGIVSFLFLIKQNRLLYDATLIRDNRILEVPSAFISTADGQEEK